MARDNLKTVPGFLREHCIIGRHALRKYIEINDIYYGCEEEEASVMLHLLHGASRFD